jgi:hypothetical protein
MLSYVMILYQSWAFALPASVIRKSIGSEFPAELDGAE